MNEVSTAPTAKISTPTKRTNWEKTVDNPRVKTRSFTEVKPKPILELKSSRKSVEATLRVKQMMVRLVWVFLRKRSLTGKDVSYILTRQSSVFQAERLVCKPHYSFVMC
jgi:hypothetical protein